MKKTIELFDKRNEQKKRLEFSMGQPKNVRIGEFWWYREGVNIGREISKDGNFTRMGLIIGKFFHGLLLIAPLTTKGDYQTHTVKIHHWEKYNLKESWIVLEQIKVIDQKRIANISGSYNPHKELVRYICEQYTLLIQKTSHAYSRRHR